MIANIPQSEQDWLSVFFSGTNEIAWTSLREGTAPQPWLALIKPWFDFFNPTLCKPLLLPWVQGNQLVAWYAMAPTEQVASQMLEELRAFVGPSYSDFTGQWMTVNECSDIEHALQTRFGSRVLRLTPCSADDRESLSQSISAYRALLLRRPTLVDRTVRPFSKIRHDFDRALLAQNPLTAQLHLDELIATGRVNAEQRKCLEIRFLAGLGRQEEIAKNRGLLESVMSLALPPQTIVDIVGALHETHIAPIENESEVSAVFERFRQTIARPYAPLFRERKGLRHPRVLRSFFLFEATQSEPNEQRCAAIVASYPEVDPGRDLLLRWRNGFEARPSSADNRERTHQAILDEDYVVAAEISLAEIPQSWAYPALLRAAVEAPSEELWNRVRQVFATAQATVLSALTPRDRARLDQVLRRTTSQTSSDAGGKDWIAWVEWVMRGGDSRVQPLAVLEAAAGKWHPDEFAQSSSDCARLAQLLGNASGEAELILRDAFPVLVEFFVSRPSRPYRSFAPIYSALISVIALNGAASGDELEIAANVARALLNVGVSREMYVDCLNDLNEVLAANSAAVHLDWALNVAEILTTYPCPDGESRIRVFVSVVELCRANRHRLARPQQRVLELLALDFGCSDMLAGIFPSEARDLPQAEAAYAGLIGIYSLDETAAERAKRTLETVLPRARVETNSDMVATDKLRNLARSADLFAFAWKSSKHQAYYCAKEARKDQEMLMPSGAGTASLVRCVLDGIRELNLSR